MIHTLLENTSLFSRREQRSIISTTVFEATVSSAWTVIVPKWTSGGLFRYVSLSVKLRSCLVTICQKDKKYLRHNEYTHSMRHYRNEVIYYMEYRYDFSNR